MATVTPERAARRQAKALARCARAARQEETRQCLDRFAAAALSEGCPAAEVASASRLTVTEVLRPDRQPQPGTAWGRCKAWYEARTDNAQCGVDLAVVAAVLVPTVFAVVYGAAWVISGWPR